MEPSNSAEERRKETSATATEESLDSFLDSMLEQGLKSIGATQGSLMLLNTRENTLEIVKRHGLPYDPKRRRHGFHGDEGIAGWVAQNCQSYLCADVEHDPLFAQPVGDLNFRSLLAVPIARGKTAIGVICADSPEVNQFNETNRKTLEHLAQEVAVKIEQLAVDTAISHTRRFKQLDSLYDVAQSLSHLTFESPEELSELLAQIAKDAQWVLGADLVTLYQYYEAEDRFETPPTLSGRFNFPHWMNSPVRHGDATDRLIKEGKPHYSENAQTDESMKPNEMRPATDDMPERPSFAVRENIVSFVGIPLTAGGEKVGVMFINYRTPHPFPEDEKHFIETFAAYAALAIQGARRFSEAMRARSLEALQRSSRMVAHRFRNILPVISDRVDLALIDGCVSGEGIEWCRQALEETFRAQRIVRDFDTFARGAEFARSDLISGMELAEKLQAIISVNLSETDAEFHAYCEPDLPMVQVNLDRLKDDFAAFSLDSKRHTSSGLCVTLSCGQANKTDIQNAGLPSSAIYLKIVFTDNGPGIDITLKQRIFEPFYTTGKGSGLGLAIAQHNARVHKGALIETGDEGKGVRFELYIPAFPAY